MVPDLIYVIVVVVCFVPVGSHSASSAHLQGFGTVRMHPHGHPLHWKVLKQFIYTYDGRVIQSEVVPGLRHVIVVVVWFVPIVTQM